MPTVKSKLSVAPQANVSGIGNTQRKKTVSKGNNRNSNREGGITAREDTNSVTELASLTGETILG